MGTGAVRAGGGRGAGMPGGPAVGKMGDMSSRERRGRAAVEGQPGLFDGRGVVEVGRSTAPAAPHAGAAAAGFTDGEPIAMLPHATPTNVERLCAAVVSRFLDEAVPALERLWRRFAGFGIGEAPCGAARRPGRTGASGLRARAGGVEADRAVEGHP